MIKASCPICDKRMEGGRLAEAPYLPFCSARCKQIDLGRWLGEAYRIPTEDQDGLLEGEEKEVP
ncbi:MAG TPA: DNA gyrase inhibitor YacG [Gemmataceae bacterium]|nr:DNA gyrase inhibitor YacG [Gemmataceae bacterium]